ncbi:hypothetical protein [Pelagimonas varians]|uniref:Uncharacterized protein n=1 Tax=Pelagimonas varians TaxID=696760 RepID=A0A238K712_9RHOB|nr:hypothetical protein [Pelagimonas varians]PYG31732.1 hypothetical protein C8N36_104152 [Pelagimonas varians]SMX38690.1 hypothetical protein PEV8663_01492 [Pelagimonas varians]
MLKEQTKPQFPKPLTPIDKIYVDSGELTRLYRLWGESVVARVTAKVQEKGGGPIGIGFLNSAEFKLICEMLDWNPDWARTQLEPFAGTNRKQAACQSIRRQ